MMLNGNTIYIYIYIYIYNGSKVIITVLDVTTHIENVFHSINVFLKGVTSIALNMRRNPRVFAFHESDIIGKMCCVH